MKAEHRKELETNVLADRMGRLITDVRKGPSGRTVLLWVLVIAAAAALVGVYLVRVTALRTNSDLWVKLDQSRKEAVQGEILKEYRDKRQGQVARMEIGWLLLWEYGIKGLPTGADALKYVKDAKKEFEALQEECKDDPVLGAEAAYNVAVAQEALAAEDLKSLEKAKELFTAVTENYKGSAYAARAAERLKAYNDAAELQKLTSFYTELNQEERTKNLKKQLGLE